MKLIKLITFTILATLSFLSTSVSANNIYKPLKNERVIVSQIKNNKVTFDLYNQKYDFNKSNENITVTASKQQLKELNTSSNFSIQNKIYFISTNNKDTLTKLTIDRKETNKLQSKTKNIILVGKIAAGLFVLLFIILAISTFFRAAIMQKYIPNKVFNQLLFVMTITGTLMFFSIMLANSMIHM